MRIGIAAAPQPYHASAATAMQHDSPTPALRTEPPVRRFPVRLLVGVAVVGAWLAAMWAIRQQESGWGGRGLEQAGISPEVLLVSWTGYEHWLWIDQERRRIGATRMTIFRHEDPTRPAERLPGYELASRTRVRPRMLGMPIQVELALDVIMNASFELESMRGLVGIAGQTLRLHAFVEGRDLYYRIMSEGGAAGEGVLGAGLGLPADVCGRAPLEGPIVLQDVVTPLLMHEERLREGKSWTVRASNPLGGVLDQAVQVSVVGREKIELDGEEHEVWKLSERMGGVQSVVYVDMEGRLMRRELPHGMVMSRAQQMAVREHDGGFNTEPALGEMDRERMRAGVSAELDGQPLRNLLGGVPLLP